MKYIKSILEKEFSQDWFESNPKNYLVKNIKELEKKKKHYQDIKNDDIKTIIYSIDYNDIILEKELSRSYTIYYCSHPKINDGLRFMNIYVYNDKDISDENSFNRIHLGLGLSINVRGTGLGYKAYKRVIKEEGFARSSEYSTNVYSRNVWSKLIKDPDFYVMTYLKKESFSSYSRKKEGVMVFHKDMDPKEIKKVIDEFSRNPKWVKIESYCEPLKKLLNI